MTWNAAFLDGFFLFSPFSVAGFSVDPLFGRCVSPLLVFFCVSDVLCGPETKTGDERDQHGRSVYVDSRKKAQKPLALMPVAIRSS